LKIAIIIGIALVALFAVGGGLMLWLVYDTVKEVEADPEAFEAIQIGQTQAEVEEVMGTTNPSFRPDGAPEQPADSSCLYYLNEDNLKQGFRVCYQDGRLTDKLQFSVD
jgi:hypothetical protein